MLASACITSLAITTATIFFTIPFSTAATNANYMSCTYNLYSCGSMKNIGYPFWGADRPRFCGHPGFNLICHDTDSTTHLYIPSLGTTKVHNISTSSYKMTISLDHFSYDCPNCHPKNQTPSHKPSLPPVFKFSPRFEKLTLFYGCNNSVTKYRSRFVGCADPDNGRNGSISYFSNMSEVIKQETTKSCRSFSVPVLKDLEDLNNGSQTLRSILRKRFELEYYAVNLTACSVCQSSGGTCGSSDNTPSSSSTSVSKFVCYCPDGSQPLQCPNSGRSKSNIIRAVIVSSALGLVTLLLIVICSRRRHSIRKFRRIRRATEEESRNVEDFLQSYGSLAPKRYTYKDIKKMTKSFKETLGEGGYGHVYKGNLVNGRPVALKVLHKLTGDGEEFLNEVLSISRTNHVNIVTLLGFCIEGNKRALVYEFLSNGSLDKFIHGAGSAKALPTETMFSIAVGIAKGLDYLHQGCNTRILHFDIKPHNILLDEDFRPKISDFGLARLFPKEQSHLSMLEARGTIGYIAPEICCRNFGGISHKSDVYSFGMMILDMVGSGRNNVPTKVQDSSESNFPQWIYDQLEIEDGAKLQEITDDEERKLQRKMIVVSLWCIQTYPVNRPSMNKVVEMLEGSLESLQMPPKPYLSSSSSSASAFDSFSMSESTT